MSRPNPRKSISLRLYICYLALAVTFSTAAHAQTFAVLHKFTGGADGANPAAGLTMDQAGNLFGTTSETFSGGTGTIFSLSNTGSGWQLNPLYTFAGGSGGFRPLARVVFGPDGSLYGTTDEGGVGKPTSQTGGCYLGCGMVFNLKLPGTETALYRFTGGRDGAYPRSGDLIFDQAGNLYGTTGNGGLPCDNPLFGCGTVFELSPSGSGWTESVLYRFAGSGDGSYPNAGLIFDQAGNLYGTTISGGVSGPECLANGCGTVFKLSPSGSGWTKSTIYSFTGGSDGSNPYAGLIIDRSGNLYGATYYNGELFKLTPSNGSWTLHILYSFVPGDGPESDLVMDGAGNIYGALFEGGLYGGGSIFMLSPAGGSWTYTSLYDFCPGADCSEGANPASKVIFDTDGNLYGTAYAGGINNNGVVWEIIP